MNPTQVCSHAEDVVVSVLLRGLDIDAVCSVCGCAGDISMCLHCCRAYCTQGQHGIAHHCHPLSVSLDDLAFRCHCCAADMPHDAAPFTGIAKTLRMQQSIRRHRKPRADAPPLELPSASDFGTTSIPDDESIEFTEVSEESEESPHHHHHHLLQFLPDELPPAPRSRHRHHLPLRDPISAMNRHRAALQRSAGAMLQRLTTDLSDAPGTDPLRCALSDVLQHAREATAQEDHSRAYCLYFAFLSLFRKHEMRGGSAEQQRAWAPLDSHHRRAFKRALRHDLLEQCLQASFAGDLGDESGVDSDDESLEFYEVGRSEARCDDDSTVRGVRGVCSICFDETDVVLPSVWCNHVGKEGMLCRECLACYVEMQVADRDGRLAATGVLACPHPTCGREIGPSDLAGLVPRGVVEELGDALTRAALLKLGSLVQCCFCGMEVLLETGSAKLCCPGCRRVSCSHHAVEWHEGLTCSSYDVVQRRRQGARDERASRELVMSSTQACPKCAAPIEKSHGCDHMTCRCGYQFCYLCKADYNKIRKHGNSAHKKSCRYHF